jgi:hypothetical protein
MSTQRISCFLATLLLVALATFAPAWGQTQGGDDAWDFTNIAADDQALPYIGVGGGYLGMVNFLNYDELNKVSASMGLGSFSGPMILSGGGGFTAIYIVPDVRLGVFGMAGSKEVNGTIPEGTGAVKRMLRFSQGMTGVQVDWAFPVFHGALTIFPGLMAAYNTFQLEGTQTEAVDSLNFGNLLPAATSVDRSFRITRPYILLYPAVNFEYSLTQFFLLRVGAGYSFNFHINDWKTPDETAVTSGFPDFYGNGATIQFGFFIGLFQ